MQTRTLGNTGLTVSLLGLGTVKLGRNTGVKYPGGEGFALPTDEQATELLRTAADCGITLIDTAPAYGTSEERLGGLMGANGWFGGRERWVVCTKAGEEFDAATGTSRYDFSPAAIRSSIERSLRRLDTDVLDVVLIHSDGRDEWIIRESGAMEALRDAQRAGRVRAVGMSTKTAAGGLLAVESGCDVVMVTLNPGHLDNLPVIAAAGAKNVGVLVKKALASGHTPDPGAALRFAAGVSGVASLIVGTASARNLRANVGAIA